MKLGDVSNFEGVLQEEKIFWGISGMALPLGISSTGKYPKIRKFVGRAKTAPKKI